MCDDISFAGVWLVTAALVLLRGSHTARSSLIEPCLDGMAGGMSSYLQLLLLVARYILQRHFTIRCGSAARILDVTPRALSANS